MKCDLLVDDDVKWFQEVHLKGTLPWLKYVLLFGNEDAPERAELYSGPLLTDHVMTIHFQTITAPPEPITPFNADRLGT